MNPHSKKVTVAGAGLVGSLLGLLLRRQGYEVQILERRSDPRLASKEVGRSINLIVTSRGLEGLRQAGIKDQALELCVPVYGREIHKSSAPTRYQAYGRNRECNFAISRSDLNNFLIDEAIGAGVEINFDSVITAVDFNKQTLEIENRSSQQYEVLIGTDGANSAVRRALLKADEDISENVEWLEADYKELHMTKTMTQGLRGEALHIWPHGTHMMMALANRDGSFTMTLYLPRSSKIDPVASFENCNTASAIENLFRRDFPDLIDRIPDYVSQFQKNPQGRLGTVRLSRWIHGGNVAVMGDAAHAIVPFFGQGMNSGFEDATELMRLLHGEQNQQEYTWRRVLEKYDSQRRPNTNAIADMALDNYIEMRDRVADPRFHEMKRLEGWIEEHFPQYISRYRLITYTLTPYSEAQRIGRQQNALLEELAKNTPLGVAPASDQVAQLLKSFSL